MRFAVTILGCHSTSPGKNRFPSAQVLNVQEQLYLIDCGEGTQMRMADYDVRHSKIDQIFISHLHGDHIFGLAGLLTTFSLMGRTKKIDIFAPPGLEEMIRLQISTSASFLTYDLLFHIVDSSKYQLIFEDVRLKVFSIPLKHRIPANGFLFREKQRNDNISKKSIEKYNIPFEMIPEIKNGSDFVDSSNRTIPNSELVLPARKPRSFAYCSDTAYLRDIVPIVEGVDLLYHETTFLDKDRDIAAKTMHSTSAQAAELARLAGVGQLITGHYSARYTNLDLFENEAKSIFPNTVLGKSGNTYKVNF